MLWPQTARPARRRRARPRPPPRRATPPSSRPRSTRMLARTVGAGQGAGQGDSRPRRRPDHARSSCATSARARPIETDDGDRAARGPAAAAPAARAGTRGEHPDLRPARRGRRRRRRTTSAQKESHQVRRRQDRHAHAGRAPGTVNRLDVALVLDPSVARADAHAARDARSQRAPASTPSAATRSTRSALAVRQAPPPRRRPRRRCPTGSSASPSTPASASASLLFLFFVAPPPAPARGRRPHRRADRGCAQIEAPRPRRRARGRAATAARRRPARRSRCDQQRRAAAASRSSRPSSASPSASLQAAARRGSSEDPHELSCRRPSPAAASRPCSRAARRPPSCSSRSAPENAAEILKHLSEREVEALSLEMATLRAASPPRWPTPSSRSSSERVIAPTRPCRAGRRRLRPRGARAPRSAPSARRRDPRGRHRGQRGRAPVRLPAPHAARADRRVPHRRVAADDRARRRQPARRRSARSVLAELPAELQPDVALRIAHDGRDQPGRRRATSTQGLREKLSNVLDARVLRRPAASRRSPRCSTSAGRSTERNVLQTIGATHADLAEEVRARLFTFEDVTDSPTATSSSCCARSTRRTSRSRCAASADEAHGEDHRATCRRRARRAAARGHRGAGRRSASTSSRRPRASIVAVVRRLEEAGTISLGGRGEEEDEELV